MPRLGINYLNDPLDKILEYVTVSRKALQNRNPDKLEANRDSHAFLIDNRTFVAIQMASKKDRRGPAEFLESFMEAYVSKHFTKEEKEKLSTIADAITARRQELIDELKTSANP